MHFAKKYPFDKLIMFLVLARNDYSAISSYLKNNNIADIDGKVIKSYEQHIKSLANIKEKAFIAKKGGSKKRKQEKLTTTLFVNIPKTLNSLALKVGIKDSPFDNDSLGLILSSAIIKKTIESYLTSRVDVNEAVTVINNKYRMNLQLKDIIGYKNWFYDISGMTPDDLFEYFDALERNDRDYKYMAYMKKADYFKWKVRDEVSISIEESTKRIAAEASYTLQDMFDDKDRVSHSAIKMWSDIFFKASDQITKLNGAGNGNDDIYAKVKLELVKHNDDDGIGDSIINYEDLAEIDGPEEDDDELVE